MSDEEIKAEVSEATEVSEQPQIKPFICKMTDYQNQQGLHIQHRELVSGTKPEGAADFVAFATIRVPTSQGTAEVPVQVPIDAENIEGAYDKAMGEIEKIKPQVEQQVRAQVTRQQLVGGQGQGGQSKKIIT